MHHRAIARLAPVLLITACRGDPPPLTERPAAPESTAKAATPAPEVPDVTGWLDAHPRLAGHLIWFVDGHWVSFPDWPDSTRTALATAFEDQWTDAPFDWPDPPPVLDQRRDDQHPMVRLPNEHAQALFFAIVARSLVVELRGDVGWSITEDGESALTTLLDGREVFGSLGADMVIGAPLQATPAPPAVVVQWLQANDLIGSTRAETIRRVLSWSRDHHVHMLHGYTTGNMERHWQYRGPPPVSRVLSGTHVDDPDLPEHDRIHFTAGCGGTVGWLHHVLRVVNVPVRSVQRPGPMGHFAAIFESEDRVLPHGDIPYDARLAEPVPIDAPLVDRETWGSWLADPAALQDKISHRSCELAVEHLSNFLPHERCRAGVDTSWLSKSLPCVADDSARAKLLARIDARIESLGGCAEVPLPSQLRHFAPEPNQ